MKHLVNAGTLHILIKLLNSENDEIQHKVVSFLVYVAEFSDDYREKLREFGIFKELIPILSKEDCEIELLRDSTKCLSFLCDINQDEDFNQIDQVIPNLLSLISHLDIQVCVNICKALCFYLSKGSSERVKKLIYSGFFIRLLRLLKRRNSMDILKYTLNVIALIQAQQNEIVNHKKGKTRIIELLDLKDDSIKIQVCKMITCIPFKSSSLHCKLIGLMDNSNTNLRLEAANALLRISQKLQDHKILNLVKN